jgi:hypothetical protein
MMKLRRMRWARHNVATIYRILSANLYRPSLTVVAERVTHLFRILEITDSNLIPKPGPLAETYFLGYNAVESA